ncbi:PAS domain-containing protein [Waterburya agarophytonicola K14]|uniref:histidine kinase n=1 Tax=Waterburya agarophytonicola KI4 TaxID=2874699 RepID=A0A964FDT3_9CYAN|nr:ATP-binding protein [Waterburya agarophytonicola]MCC0175975.1 PAS domain-containing protein [Waterburya agarophytonicola KI4]
MNHDRSYLTKTEVAKQLGYFPAFLIPAINSSLIFRTLSQQTLSAYVNNPLPSLFKEKLFVCLSRHFGVSYFTVCHSCTLRSLGMNATEILALEEITNPHTEDDLIADLELLNSQWHDSIPWQNNPQLEKILLRCSCLIFLDRSQTNKCVETLKQFLGEVYYNYLVIFLGYIKLCHQWVSSNPGISHQQDPRSQAHLGSLLLSESRLIKFFQSNLQLDNSPSSTSSLNLLSAKKSCISSPLRVSPTSSTTVRLNWQQKQVALTEYLANLPFPVMIHSHNEEILYLNHNWIETTGYNMGETSTLTQWKQKAQVKQHKLRKRFPPEVSLRNNTRKISRLSDIETQTQNILRQIAKSLSNLAEEIAQIEIEAQIERATVNEVSIITSRGERRFWESYSAPFNLDNEPEQLTISIAKDITEVVTQATQLMEVEDKLNSVLKATNTGGWSWDLINNQINICDRSRDILGLNEFDGSYGSFLQSIHPEAKESIDLSLIKAIKTDRNIDLKYPIIRDSYAICWIRLQGKLRYNSAREVIRVTGIVMDITKDQENSPKVKLNFQQDRQQNVTKSNQELVNIINVLPSYVFVIDVGDKTISLINLKLSRSLGVSDPDYFKGKTIYECFSSEYTRQILWQEQQVLTYAKEIHVQEEVVLSDGIHYFDTTITPLHNESGEIYALLHTSNDIPDLGATKEELSERTLQLEAANKELESFSYSVSHDLQAPLRVINGFSQVLWENYQPNLDDRGKHYLQRIQANSERMSDLIDALLQLSRVTRSQMESVQVNLSKIAEDIIEELQGEDPQRQVEFITSGNITAKGDPQLLRIVLDNLLNNAWKYTSKRSQTKIEFNAISSGQDKLTFYVRDNGAGFDLEYADKLFTAFKRLHTQQEFPGTGIGLATVKRIIYRHGGKVWADGATDNGATIYFTL